MLALAKLTGARMAASDAREKSHDPASALFYALSVRAVGVDLVVEKAGVAKTSLYRHFGTKDDLVCAFLEYMDCVFWKEWNAVSELYAQLERLGKIAGEADYRGCAQINASAEFPELAHPARKIANTHKRELRR